MSSVFHKLRDWLKRSGYRTPAAPSITYEEYCLRKGDEIIPRPTLPLPPIAQDLTQNEVEDWKLFLASPTGQKGLERVRAVHYQMMGAVTARGPQHVSASAYRADGFADCYRYIVSLGHIQVPPEKAKPESEEEAENVVWEERVSP